MAALPDKDDLMRAARAAVETGDLKDQAAPVQAASIPARILRKPRPFWKLWARRSDPYAVSIARIELWLELISARHPRQASLAPTAMNPAAKVEGREAA